MAEDLVQETLSKALRKSSQLRDLKALDGWLFSILTNCWRDHFRKHVDMEDIDEIDELNLASDLTPEDACAQNEVVNRVRAAVAALPPGQRQVLTLVDLEEFSYSEVAEILDIPVGTVMSRLSRARQALTTKLLRTAQTSATSRAANIVRFK
ncbi:hypothetical protein GCM10027419_50070 [Pandoraea terrae]